MEIRNIQKTGGSSLTLTLPKQWIKDHYLKDKDKVSIYTQKSGNLFVQPFFTAQKRLYGSLTIDELTPQMIIREIIGLYVSGADEIAVIGKKITFEKRQAVREVLSRLIGFEILDETATNIVIKNIFDLKKFSTAENIEKMFLIAQSMHTDCMMALESGDKNMATDVIFRDIEIDKLTIAIIRQFHSLVKNRASEEELGLTIEELHFLQTMRIQLESIVDHIVKIAQTVNDGVKLQLSHNSLLYRRLKAIVMYLAETKQMVMELDKKNAHRFLDKQKEFEQTLPTQTIIENSLDRIHGYLTNIAEETINYTVGKSR